MISFSMKIKKSKDRPHSSIAERYVSLIFFQIVFLEKKTIKRSTKVRRQDSVRDVGSERKQVGHSHPLVLLSEGEIEAIIIIKIKIIIIIIIIIITVYIFIK